MGLPVANPTYLLAPNWTFRPGGPIALGNIIANPFKPHIVLTKPDPDTPQPKTTTVTETDWRLVDGGGLTLSLGLWANFLESIQVKLGIDRRTNLKSEYSAETLETTYFEDGITTDHVRDRAKDPIITTLMTPGSIMSKPVYMVTGIKVAKGFRLSAEAASACGAELSATVPTGGPASVGAGGKFGVDKSQSYGFAADNVVFAYQLLKMAPKGWGKNKAVYGKEYQSTGSLLGDEGGDDGDVDLDVEYSYFVTSDLNDAGVNPDQAANLNHGTTADGKEQYSVVSSKD
jgi:hypothetical protein